MERSFHFDDLNQEMERLKRVIEEGERAIIRQLDGISRADKLTPPAANDRGAASNASASNLCDYLPGFPIPDRRWRRASLAEHSPSRDIQRA